MRAGPGLPVEFAPEARRTVLATARARGLPVLVVLLVSAGHAMAAPFLSNQNQYLAQVQAARVPSLSSDWFVGTTDPYPLFSAVMALVTNLGGIAGLRVLAFLGTVAALTGVYHLARTVSPVTSRGVPLVATALVGATLVVVPPGVMVVSGTMMSGFSGLAGQYLLSKPGYVQPSLAGCLLLLALPLWLQGLRGESHCLRRTATAWALTCLACMLHPTYMVATLAALLAASGADLVTRAGWRRFPVYAAIALTVVVATLAANPAMVGLAATAEGGSGALDRFAFTRIPHHTLWPDWPPTDLWRLLLVCVAMRLLLGMREGRWLSTWLGFAVAVAVLSAVTVELTRWSTLALAFPWRVSVLLVPISATVLATWLTARARRLAGRHWRRYLIGSSAVLAAVGLDATLDAAPPVVTDNATALVHASKPRGIGLIPLEAENVRLNAEVPVYVDWKSPPYAADDLTEWWQRVDRVQAFEADPETFCTGSWAASVDWMLVEATDGAPSCVSSWTEVGASRQWRVLQRPHARADLSHPVVS